MILPGLIPLSRTNEPLYKAACIAHLAGRGVPLDSASILVGYTSPSGARSALERYTPGASRATPAAALAQLFARDASARIGHPCQFTASALAIVGGYIAGQKRASDLDASLGDSRA